MSAQPTPEPQSTPGAQSSTSTGLEPHVGSLLAYAFGWISGLILFLMETENREVRFHAAQSILLCIALLAVYIPLFVLSLVPVIGFLGWLATVAVGLGAFALWIYLLIQGWNLHHVKLPMIGDMAEQWAAR